MGSGDDQELRQADFSKLRVHEMTPQQRAELRRRYVDFVRHFDGAPPAAGRPEAGGKRIRKWVPGAKG
jgi:hypothetical protein